MRRKKRVAQTVCEKQVAGFFGMRRFDSRTAREPANFFQRARQAGGVACELCRRGVGQHLTLTANSSLDQSSEEYACRSTDNQRRRRKSGNRPEKKPPPPNKKKSAPSPTKGGGFFRARVRRRTRPITVR